MKKYIIPAVLALVLITACEKTVVIDIPQKAPSLVLNAWMEKGRVVTVKVGKSRHILSAVDNNMNESYVVKNAVPILYENNIPIDTLVYRPIEYDYKSIHNTVVREGFNYTLKVSAPGFATVEASTLVPSQSSIASLSRLKDARINNMNQHMDEIQLKINDPSEKNFYLIRIYGPSYGQGTEGYPVYCVSTTDKDIEPIGENADPLSTDNCYDGANLIMKDQNFNGGTKQLRFYVESYSLNEYVDGTTGRTNRPYLKVFRITEEQFKYIKSYNVYYNSSDNPFAEPVNVYSNVKSGYGIVSAYTMAVDTLR